MKFNLWGDSILIEHFEDETFYKIVHKILSDSIQKKLSVKKSNKNGFQTLNIHNRYVNEKILHIHVSYHYNFVLI